MCTGQHLKQTIIWGTITHEQLVFVIQLLHLSLKFRAQKLLRNVRCHMHSRAKTTNGHEIIRWVTSANQIP